MVRFVRPLPLCLLTVAIATTGCSWFRGDKSEYLESTQARPLEVPPDLVLPNNAGALQVPAAPESAAAPSEVAGFLLADSVDGAFRRVGIALARIDGVSATKPVQALSSHEVQFRGSDFLIRIEPADAQAKISAVTPDGAAVSTGAAAELLSALRTRLQ